MAGRGGERGPAPPPGGGGGAPARPPSGCGPAVGGRPGPCRPASATGRRPPARLLQPRLCANSRFGSAPGWTTGGWCSRPVDGLIPSHRIPSQCCAHTATAVRPRSGTRSGPPPTRLLSSRYATISIGLVGPQLRRLQNGPVCRTGWGGRGQAGRWEKGREERSPSPTSTSAPINPAPPSLTGPTTNGTVSHGPGGPCGAGAEGRTGGGRGPHLRCDK